jgi:hypothetical protein
MVAGVAVGGVGRDDVRRPAEQAARADPKPRCDDEPQDAGQDAAVVELSHPWDDRAQNRCQCRITHRCLPPCSLLPKECLPAVVRPRFFPIVRL